MAKLIPLVSDTLWHRIETEPKDWESTDPALLSRMLEQLYIIRAFEEKVLELFKAEERFNPPKGSTAIM